MSEFTDDTIFLLNSCEHIFHKECLERFCKEEISLKKGKLGCPECKKEIIYTDLKMLLAEDDLRKYDLQVIRHST